MEIVENLTEYSMYRHVLIYLAGLSAVKVSMSYNSYKLPSDGVNFLSLLCYILLMLKVLALDKLRHQLPTVLTGEKHDPSIGNSLERGLNNCLILISNLDLSTLHRFGQCIYCLLCSR